MFAMTTSESQLEEALIEKLRALKFEIRPDICDRAALEANFREKFQALNHVHLTDAEFHRLLDEIITPDVFTAARTLRKRNAFTRDDGTPLNFTLINIKDWCKNTFEVINQLRINTDNSHHRYDVILLINGVPLVQIELKTLGIRLRGGKHQHRRFSATAPFRWPNRGDEAVARVTGYLDDFITAVQSKFEISVPRPWLFALSGGGTDGLWCCHREAANTAGAGGHRFIGRQCRRA